MEHGQPATAGIGRVLGTEDATPLQFSVGLEDGRWLQLDDVVITHRELPDGQVIRLSGVVTGLRARQEGARFDSDVFLINDGVLPAKDVEVAEVTTTRVEPEIYVPPRPGVDGLQGRGSRTRARPVLRPDARQAADRARPGRRAALRQPRVPRRDPWRARQHLGHLRGGDEDDLRHVPAPQPVRLARARRRGAQHQGPRLQRERGGSALPRPGEQRAGGGGPRALPPARSSRRTIRLGGLLRPAAPCRPERRARRGDPRLRRRRLLLDPGRVLRAGAPAICLRRRRGRPEPVHPRHPQRHLGAQARRQARRRRRRLGDRRRGADDLRRARRARRRPGDGQSTRPAWAGPAIGTGTVSAFVRRLYGSVARPRRAGACRRAVAAPTTPSPPPARR